jgi:hypothetical protein
MLGSKMLSFPTSYGRRDCRLLVRWCRISPSRYSDLVSTLLLPVPSRSAFRTLKGGQSRCRGRNYSKKTEREEDEEIIKETEDADDPVIGGGTRLQVQPKCKYLGLLETRTFVKSMDFDNLTWADCRLMD